MAREFTAGEVFTRKHPFTFVVEKTGLPDVEFEQWRPGAWESTYLAPDEMIAACHAEGTVTYTVISSHRPPGYETRIFFKREFMTPEGKRYAPARLHNCILRKFVRDITKFQFQYEIVEL